MATELSRLSSILTAYWKTDTIETSWKLGIFESLRKHRLTLQEILEVHDLNKMAGFHLVKGLERLGLIKEEQGYFRLTQFGLLFSTESINNPIYMIRFWKKEQRDAWNLLDKAVQTGKEQFSTMTGQRLFDWVQTDDEKVMEFYSALHQYALVDYHEFPKIVDIPERLTITDVGGGIGTLLQLVAERKPNSKLVLFDLPATVEFAKKHNHDSRIQYVSGSFFDDDIPESDIIILARVLHDWDDNHAEKILVNCKSALKPSGKMFVIERIFGEQNYNPFLQLNLLVLVGGRERTYEEFQDLLQKVGLKVRNRMDLSTGPSVLECGRR